MERFCEIGESVKWLLLLLVLIDGHVWWVAFERFLCGDDKVIKPWLILLFCTVRMWSVDEVTGKTSNEQKRKKKYLF